MQATENRSINGKRITIDAAELEKINIANPTAAFTMADVEDKKLFAVEAVITDSLPNRNNRQYTPQWQQAMESKWAGTKLVYSNSDHDANAPDEYGWIYSAALETTATKTATVARMVVPVITDTARLVERLRAGLSHSLSIAAEVETVVCSDCGKALTTLQCGEHPEGVVRIEGGGAPIHVAIVADPACAGAGIRATSESRGIRVVETVAEVDESATLLIEDARRLRAPVIDDAIKYARLCNASLEPDQLRERLGKWTYAEITEYANTQKENYRRKNPQASRQLATAEASDEKQKPPVIWKSLAEITRENKP